MSGRRDAFIAYFGPGVWVPGEPCPSCGCPYAAHSETSRIVGCEHVAEEAGHTVICGCRRLRGENAPDQEQAP